MVEPKSKTAWKTNMFHQLSVDTERWTIDPLPPFLLKLFFHRQWCFRMLSLHQ